jgi:SAM-dependent methyltransferase
MPVNQTSLNNHNANDGSQPASKEGGDVGQELDLMRFYPKGNDRMAERKKITEEQRRISQMFSFDYFDGNRMHGYGGYSYHPRFWSETVRLFADHYSLAADASILDVGCAKGFMLKDFAALMPNIAFTGIDISQYAINNADPAVRDHLAVGNARDLPYQNNAFDFVISINTIHNLPRNDAVTALREIERVSRGNSFIMVDGWRTEKEKIDLENWVLTARTLLHVEAWSLLFEEAGYTGDYSFWVPN